jgi:hypothetical protein
MPAMKARVFSFKEEPSEAEAEEDVEDLGHGSGHGCTEESKETCGDFNEGEA